MSLWLRNDSIGQIYLTIYQTDVGGFQGRLKFWIQERKPMQNRRTTAQINANTLSRLKEVAKARNQPLYVLLDEAVLEFLKNPNIRKESKEVELNQRQKKKVYRQFLELKPFTGKNKWITSGVGGIVWFLYTMLPEAK